MSLTFYYIYINKIGKNDFKKHSRGVSLCI